MWVKHDFYDTFASLEPIILIGPIGAGKTTISELLSPMLSVPFYSLDKEEEQHAVPLGYNPDQYQKMMKQDRVKGHEYRRSFFDGAVDRFLKAHTHGILDFGGMHVVVPDPQKQMQIKDRLQSYRNIFFLFPTPDVEDSLRILRERDELADFEANLNTMSFQNGNRTFWDIAKHVIYTEGKTPNQVCLEIKEKLM